MRRARPSSWISGAAFLHPAGTSDSGAATAANADAAASPRERELRAALGSDEVLPNNVTLLMSRRQRGEESDGEEGEEDGELELEDVVLDDEEAGPGSAGGDGDAVAAGRTVAEQQQQHSIGGGAITPLIHQVLRRPLTWRPPSPSPAPQREERDEEEQPRQQQGSPRQDEEQGGGRPDENHQPTTPAAPTLGPAALALLLSAFLVRARREQQQRDRRRVYPSMSSRSSSSSAASSNDTEDVEAASRDGTGTGAGGVVGGVRAGLQGCWALVSGAMRRNHLVVLYCFGAFVLVRMWFFAFARKDSKLISFCAFIMFLAAYIWWTRRVRAARLHAAQAAAAAAARQLGARRGGLFEGMDLRELQNIMMEARLHEDQRERGLSAAGKAALVHFSYKKPPSTPNSAAPAPAKPEAAAGGGGFVGGPGEEEEEPLAPTVSRQSSSCLSLAASTKQPSGVWTEEGQDGAGGCCGLSEGAGKEGGASSGGSRMKDEEEEEEEEEEEMGPKKERPSSPGASYYPTDALIDNQCSICLNEYDEGDSLTLLPICKHVFHDACISVWLARHVRCPLCQFDLSVLGSSSSSSGAEEAHLDRPPFGPSTASITATPMAPRRRGGWRPVYGEGGSDGEEQDDEQEQEQGHGGGGGGNRRVMTIVNEPAQHPVMRIVAVDVGEDHSR